MNNKIAGAHVLRLYVWEALKSNKVLSEITLPNTTGTFIPLIPVEDNREFADSGKDYGVYGYAEQNNTNLPMVTGNFIIRLFTRDFSKAVEVINVLSSVFELGDTAAGDMNRWSSNQPNNPFSGIRFTYAKLAYADAGDVPEKSEGGRMISLINIDYSYIRDYSDNVKKYNGTTWS